MKTIDVLILLLLLSGLIIGFILGNKGQETQSNIHIPIYENQQPSWLSPFYKMETISTIRDPIQNTLHNALYSD